jgi:hypothetical protein
MNRKKWLISALIAVSLTAAISDGLFYWFNVEANPSTASLTEFLKIILLVLWVDADSKNYPQITKPFDYGFLVYLFWVPYLPYYLWRTRGPLGLLMFSGLLALFLLGWLVQMSIYLARAA